MRLSDTLLRSGRNLRQAKARTLLTALAIGVGAFALTLTLAASNGAQGFVNKIIADNFDPSELIVTKDNSLFGKTDTSKPQVYDDSYVATTSRAGATTQVKQLTNDDITKIQAIKGVEEVRKDLSISLQYITRPGQKKYIGTVNAFSPSQNPDLVAGKLVKPLKNDSILVPEAFVSALGFKNDNQAVGQELTLAVRKPFDQAILEQALQQGGAVNDAKLQQLDQQSTYTKTFTIAAVLKKPTTVQPGTELDMYINAADADTLNDVATQGTASYHRYTIVYARINNGKDKAVLKAAQQRITKAGYSTQSVEDTEAFLTQIITVLRGIVAAFGAIAVIASVFGVVNTMYISVLQRTREIGLMKALGMPKRDVGRLFKVEAAWIGFLGGALGSLLAFAVGTALNPWITKKLDFGGQRLLIFRLPQVVVLIVALMLVAIFAGLLPARKAAKLDPIEALRTE